MHARQRVLRSATAALVWLSIASGSLAELPDKPEGKPPADAAVIHVAPDGNDAWSGRPAAPNADQTDGPLATLAAARDRVRGMKARDGGLRGSVTILIRGGVYPQDHPLVFTAEDSGAAERPVTYSAYPGETPVISGGRAIGGWEPGDGEHGRLRCGGGLWRARVPALPDGRAWTFNQLFVNGARRIRARTPNDREFFHTDGPVAREDRRRFNFRAGDIRPWPDLSGAIIVAYHSWETSIHHILDVDTDACAVVLKEPAPWPFGRWQRHQRYYVENVFEALDSPGEWYLDASSATVFYYPVPGENMADAEVIAPVIPATLIEFAGKPGSDEFIEHLQFKGIAFRHTNANLRRLRNPGQGEVYQPAMIQAVGLRRSMFLDCEIAYAGGHGIWLGAGCADNEIDRCHIHSLAGGGVYIGGGWGVQEDAPVERNTVNNCFIHDGGHLFRGAHGVWIGRSSFNAVTHNEISNFDYTGVSCGWSWGFHPSSANHNRIEFNHIHHLGNGDGLGDMGGIYTLGVSPGTTLRYNHIHDVYNYAHVSHGSGIYPDEGSSEILIEFNVVHRVRNNPLFMHYGRDCVATNNILALGDKGQLFRAREDKRCHYAAEGNIVYGDLREMLAGRWTNGDWKLGRNVYWSTAGEPLFTGMDFVAWQAHAGDSGSIVADPLFVDPSAGDFRLRPESPAFTLGFQPIDLSRTGLVGDPAWTSLPSQYPDRARNDVAPPVGRPPIIHFDFEADRAGADPMEGELVAGENGASVRVSDEAAAGGRHSLKFTDAPGQQHGWTPHIYYERTYDQGAVRLSWDMLNSANRPAAFMIEARDYAPGGGRYRTGPRVSVSPTGSVTAGGRELGRIPAGQWARVEIEMELGENAPKSFSIALHPPHGDPVRAEIPYGDTEFSRITWLGIMSISADRAEFHIDNLSMGTAEELAQPPVRRPLRMRGAADREAESPGKPDAVGHWTFGDLRGCLVRDLSGSGNHGELWGELAIGEFGAALQCDTFGPGMIVPDHASLHLEDSDFTISLWLCPTRLDIASSDPRRRILEKTDVPRSWWVLDIGSDGRPKIEMRSAGGGMASARSAGVIREGVWTHLAVVVDRGNREVRFVINGIEEPPVKLPAQFSGFLDVSGIDLQVGSTWQPFIGLIDELIILRRAASAVEIAGVVERDRASRTSAAYRIRE